jgi:hypothetical protein
MRGLIHTLRLRWLRFCIAINAAERFNERRHHQSILANLDARRDHFESELRRLEVQAMGARTIC